MTDLERFMILVEGFHDSFHRYMVFVVDIDVTGDT
jgi:hypothetical protein